MLRCCLNWATDNPPYITYQTETCFYSSRQYHNGNDRKFLRMLVQVSSPQLCFIIVFICDLFVSRDDALMSKKTFMRTEQLYVLSHDRSRGRGLVPVKPVLTPQYFNTDRSKAVLLLWFLTITCSCCPYLYFGSAIMLVIYFVNFR